MNNQRITGSILEANGLKKTPIRIEILDLFMSHDFALSASDIVDKMKAGNDRVTVYRALASFEKRGILHKASEDGQGAKYALCSHRHRSKIPFDQHAHFVCDECQKTYCLEEVVIPSVEVSDEFIVNRVNYTIHGICKACKTQSVT